MCDSLHIDYTTPVLVTGATGYVAGVLIEQLLGIGLTIHSTVRDPCNTTSIQYLVDLANKSPGSIKFFRGELLEEGSFAEAMKECSTVFHVASPANMKKTEDPQRDVVEPAVIATRNVLNEATKAGTVKRVVVTSSCAAIFCDASDTNKTVNGKLTEENWNAGASLEYNTFAHAKTKAELAAWEIAGSQIKWSMVVMNPGVIMGPGLKYHENSVSFQLINRLGGGQRKRGCPNICRAVVDVRDVARAHIIAAFSERAKGRYILASTNTSFVEMARVLREQFPEYPIPQRPLPKIIVWLAAPYTVGVDRRFVLNNVDRPINVDSSKSKQDLGIQYRPLSETLNTMFQQLVDEGVLKRDLNVYQLLGSLPTPRNLTWLMNWLLWAMPKWSNAQKPPKKV